VNLDRQDGVYRAKANSNALTLWSLQVKAGDLLEATESGIANSRMILADRPDVDKYDLAKPNTNPFFPHPDDAPEATFTTLPGRDRDGRVLVFAARKDATLWLASNSYGEKEREFDLTIKPTARTFVADQKVGAQLRIASTDYWSFDAKAGDVMRFNVAATGFTQQVVVLDPDLSTVQTLYPSLDESTIKWNTIVQRTGRYILGLSCYGNGGGGSYTMARKVFPVKTFGVGSPAHGDFADGQVHVWKLTAMPEEPLFIRWKSSGPYSVDIRDESGKQAGFILTSIDKTTQCGILKVDKTTTYLIALTPYTAKASYSIEVTDLREGK